MTQKERNKQRFFANAIQLYGTTYGYSMVEYVDMRTEVGIICPQHGVVYMTPRQHIENVGGCALCKEWYERKKAFKNYKDKAHKKYNYKFDYTQFIYINAKTKSTIICPQHGPFLQNMDKHIITEHGCPECWEGYRKSGVFQGIERKSSPGVSEDEFIERATTKFGTQFEYDMRQYTGITGDLISIRCSKHGWFIKQPRNFIITTYGCDECANERRIISKTKTYSEFLLDANKKHNLKYKYPDSNKLTFKNRNSKVKIICKKHGEYAKRAIKHLTGQGCPACNTERLVREGKLVGGVQCTII